MINVIIQQLKKNGYVWDLGQLDKETLSFLNKMLYNGELTRTKEYWNGILEKIIYRLK